MNVKELVEEIITADSEAAGKHVNELADRLRAGGDLGCLKPLLNHQDPDLVGCGLWIASEVMAGSRGREIISELATLLHHGTASVRFEALKAVARCLSPADVDLTADVLQMLVDENAGVRRQALVQCCLLQDAVVAPLTSRDCKDASLLLAGTPRHELSAAVRSSESLRQRLGMSGALRHHGGDEGFIAELAEHVDPEVREKLPTLPRHRSFVGVFARGKA